MWLWLLAFVTSASKQKSCRFRVQLCWLWISGYRPSENWLVSMAASLVQCLWEEGKSRAPVQKAEQIQVNHLPPVAAGCAQEWAQNQHSPLTYWHPLLGGEYLMPSHRCAGGRFWTAGGREIKQCDLGAAHFHNGQAYVESHCTPSSMGWGGSQSTAGCLAQRGIHPLQRSSVNIYNLLFLITQSWKGLLGQEKKR